VPRLPPCAGNVTRKWKDGVALDRCALFVDANYALAEGALAVHGTRNRDSVTWDYAGLLKLLGSLSRDRTGLQLLRCYWYDTPAADGSRAGEHDTLADIPGVKLRLSRLRPNRKEDVEAEIRRDLTALARNRAISDVIIVSAEEDLAPVVAEVQDLGIRTVLLHIAATDGDWTSARALRQEFDDIIDIGSGHLRPYVDLIAGAEPQFAASGYREIPVSAAQISGPQAAIEAPAPPLYGTPVAYQPAAEFAAAAPGEGQRRDAPFAGQGGDPGHGGDPRRGDPRRADDPVSPQPAQSAPDQSRQQVSASRLEPGSATAEPGLPARVPHDVRAQQATGQQAVGQQLQAQQQVQAQQVQAQQVQAQQVQGQHVHGQPQRGIPDGQHYQQQGVGRDHMADAHEAGASTVGSHNGLAE